MWDVPVFFFFSVSQSFRFHTRDEYRGAVWRESHVDWVAEFSRREDRPGNGTLQLPGAA